MHVEGIREYHPSAIARISAGYILLILDTMEDSRESTAISNENQRFMHEPNQRTYGLPQVLVVRSTGLEPA